MSAHTEFEGPHLGEILDRADDWRADAEVIDRLRRDESTWVLRVDGDRIAASEEGVPHWTHPGESPTVARAFTEPTAWALLGRDVYGNGLLLAAEPTGGIDSTSASLRAFVTDADTPEAMVLIAAVALARWLRDAPFCSTCGAHTRLVAAGWARHCDACGRDHFPRTDPAVIVAISSQDGSRLLLGRNARWGDRPVFSTFAGFVEAGESLESAIVREIREEAGVTVTDVEYRGSQAWPYPRSLMVAFRARAIDDSHARPDGEEIVDVRWFTPTELVAMGDDPSDSGPRLPGRGSIAHRLITEWAAEARADG